MEDTLNQFANSTTELTCIVLRHIVQPYLWKSSVQICFHSLNIVIHDLENIPAKIVNRRPFGLGDFEFALI